MGEEPNIIGPWRKVSILGSGGFGIVSLWRNDESDVSVAVKKCRWSIPSQIPEKQKQRWIQEVKIMRELDHDNIVRFQPLDEEFAASLDRHNLSRLPLLPMEYCTLGNLRHSLKAPMHSCGLPEPELRCFLKDLNSAISYLHLRKITHRDIKPENVVLQQTNSRSNGLLYKLIDLGYAKELGSVVASFVGTLHYLAPEIFKHNNYSCKVDYWSFGIIVFEAICGLHPFMLNSKLTPIEKFEYLEKKEDSHICIYRSRSGEIKYSHEIIKEHHLSPVFQKYLEDWVRVVLRYDPEARGTFDDGRNVFDKLTEILNKKIVRVFSLPSYQFLYYEVDEETLVSSLQQWIEKDTGVLVEEQLLITQRIYHDPDPKRKVFQCFTEVNCSTTIYLFKKRTYVFKEEVKLPPIIKSLMRNPNACANWDELYSQTSLCVHYLRNQVTLMTSLKASLALKFHYTRSLLKKQDGVYRDLNNSAKKLLNQIEVYRDFHVELQNLYLANQSNSELLRTYRKFLWQSRELLENVNAADARYARLRKNDMLLQISFKNLTETLNEYKPEEIFKKGFECLRIQTHRSPLTSSAITGVLFSYFKDRSSLVSNEDVEDYLMASYKISREAHRLIKWMNALGLQVKKLCDDIKMNQIEMFKNVSPKKETSRNMLGGELDCEDLLEVNRNLRYQNQELFSRLITMDFESIQF